MNKNDIKVLFPESVETITISKNDYDRLYGQLTYENIILQSKIDKAIEMIEFDKKDRMWDLGEGNIMILQEKRVNELLDILKENK